MERRIEQLTTETDMIGMQVVKKNGIISNQDDKIRMLELTLDRGEKQYKQRLDDIKLLKMEIKRLRREKNLLARGIENITDLRLEVFNLEKDLDREKQRVRALEEALETPLNIHRWRKLQSTDPASLEMLDKIKILQEKLLSKSDKIKELNNDCAELKSNIEYGKTDLELKEEIILNKKTIYNQREKIKTLQTELDTKEAQLNEYKLDFENIKSELKLFKDKVFFMKTESFPHSPVKISSGESRTQDKSNAVDIQSPKKYLGGGFMISPVSSGTQLHKTKGSGN